MSSFAGDNVFCQSNLDIIATKTKWIDGPCNIHSVYFIPSASSSTVGFLDYYAGDPDSGGVLRLRVPTTYAPGSSMQGAIYLKIPLNGIRFDDSVWAKLSGSSQAEPSSSMIIYSGAESTL